MEENNEQETIINTDESTDGQPNITNMFENMTQTSEFSDLMSTLLGSVQNGLNGQNINMQNILNSCNLDDNIEEVDNISLDNIENTSEISAESDDILECEISQAGLTETIDNVNFKITELGNLMTNLFTDSDGNSIAEILSNISKKLEKNN